jgi:hypothetical protein
MISYDEAMLRAFRTVGSSASADLLRLARELRKNGSQQPAATDPFATPEYVHRLLDAWLSGEMLDFKGASVPDDIRERIEREVRWPLQDDPPVVPAPDTGEQLVNLAGYVDRVNAAEADIAAAVRPECETCGGALRVEIDRKDVTPYPGAEPAYLDGVRHYTHLLTTQPDGQPWDHLAVPRKTPRPGDVGGETTAIIDAVRVNPMVVNEARTEVLDLGANRSCMHCAATIRQSANGGVDWIHIRTGQRVCAGEGQHTFAWPAAETNGE